MTIRPGLIFPAVAPEGAGQHEADWRVDAYSSAEVALAKAAQGMVMRAVVVDTRWQAWNVLADHVQLDVIQRASARGGAERHAANHANHAVGEEAQACNRPEVELF